MLDVVCVGILVADALAKNVDALPEKGKLLPIESVQLCSGGCAMNTAVDLAKMGAKTAVVGMIGDDGFGRFMKNEIIRSGMDADGVKITREAGTSASVALIDQSGERSFLHYVGANGIFSEADIDWNVVDRSNLVFVAGSMLMPSFDGEGCASFLKKCKEKGKTTILDTAWDNHGRWMSLLKDSMPYIDYFIPSIEEARELSGEREPEAIAERFFELGVQHVVIKVGKRGCYLQETAEDEGVYLPTYDRVKAVDTTGAGDSFCAGFLYGLSKGMSMKESCRLANAVGTHCIMAVGASTGIKPYEEIKKFMEDYENGCN